MHADIPRSHNGPKYLDDLSPGSSQTSSSVSQDRTGYELLGHSGRAGLLLAPSKIRSPTPPLLFGRDSVVKMKESLVPSQQVGKSDSRLARVAIDSGIKANGRLARAMAHSSEDQDWETISELKDGVAKGKATPAENATESSLADNSDSGDLSVSKEIYGTGGTAHHPQQPRQNQSFMFMSMRDFTGRSARIPCQEWEVESSLADVNAGTQFGLRSSTNMGTYRHPQPLSRQHLNPFLTQPPGMNAVHMGSEPHNLGSLEGVDKIEHICERKLSHKVEETFFQPELGGRHSQIGMIPNDQSRQSSAWLSTVSEGDSGEISLSVHKGSFAKMTVLSHKGNVTGSPDGTGAREVGSSLADASSPNANFSSSPQPLGSPSPGQILKSDIAFNHNDDNFSVKSHVNEQSLPGIGQNHHFSSNHNPLPTPQSQFLPIPNHHSVSSKLSTATRSLSSPATTPKSFGPNLPPTTAGEKTNPWLRYLPPTGPRSKVRKNSPCRRRCSSESDSKLQASPSVKKASTILPLASHVDRKYNRSNGLSMRDTFAHSDNEICPENESTSSPIEASTKESQPQISNPSTPNTPRSRPTYHEGVVYTEIPSPIFNHPVYGRGRLFDSLPARTACSRDRLDQYPRPIARADSPHLHLVPRRPSTQVIRLQKKLSKQYLWVVCGLVPLSLLYGHGLLDGVMEWHTHGEINGFSDIEKVFALVWGYGILVTVIVALVVWITVAGA